MSKRFWIVMAFFRSSTFAMLAIREEIKYGMIETVEQAVLVDHYREACR